MILAMHEIFIYEIFRIYGRDEEKKWHKQQSFDEECKMGSKILFLSNCFLLARLSLSIVRLWWDVKNQTKKIRRRRKKGGYSHEPQLLLSHNVK